MTFVVSYPEIGEVWTLNCNDICAKSCKQCSRGRQSDNTAYFDNLDTCQRTAVVRWWKWHRRDGRSAKDLLVIHDRVASRGFAHRRLSPMLWGVADLSGETMLHVLQLKVSRRILRDLGFDDVVCVVLRSCRSVRINAISFQKANGV